MQLLKITHIPMEYEMKIERPKLEMRQAKAQVQMETEAGQLRIESENIKVRMDTYEARRSIGLRSSGDMADELAQKGKQAASEATALYAEVGNRMAQIQKDATIADAVYPRLIHHRGTELVFLPNVGPEINWQPNQLSIDFQPAKVTLDPELVPAEITYVPGSMSIEIKQYPKVEIEYLGEPRYVPPSANPNYEENEDS